MNQGIPVQPKTKGVLDISAATIAKLSIAAVAFYILYSIRDIFIWFVFALLITVLFNPAIDFLQRKRIPRVLGVVAVYVGVLGIFTLMVFLVVPLFMQEVKEFTQAFPEYFEKIAPPLRGLGLEAFENMESFLESFSNTLEGMSSNIFLAVFAIFGGMLATIFIITMAIFLSLEEKFIEKTIFLIFPKKYEAMALSVWRRVQRKVAGWFGARILVCIFVGVAAYITFLIFNVSYPFTLALFAGIFNFIPYIGPLLTGIILFVLIFPAEPLKAIFVLVAFWLIQQIDGNILSPILMKKFIGLPPAIVLVALVVGAQLWGILGAILVVPLAGILFEFLREFLQRRKEQKAVVL